MGGAGFFPSSFCMLLAGAEEEKTAELLHLREDLIEGRAWYTSNSSSV